MPLPLPNENPAHQTPKLTLHANGPDTLPALHWLARTTTACCPPPLASQAARAAVRELPSRLTHRVCVPFGPHAFFPGKLRHTNELTVPLGGRHFAQVGCRRGGVQRQARALVPM